MGFCLFVRLRAHSCWLLAIRHWLDYKQCLSRYLDPAIIPDNGIRQLAIIHA